MVRRLVAACTAMTLGAVAATVPAGPAIAATWSVVPTPNPNAQSNHFTGIDAQSTTSAWTVGWGYTGGTPSTRPVVARWNGTAWSAVGHPAFATDAYLFGVDGDSAGNAWAVGRAGVNPLIERWNGGAWGVVPAPLPAGATGGELHGVKSLSGTSAWAVGAVTGSGSPFTRTYATRWNGSSWSVVPTPNPDPHHNTLKAIDGVSAGDMWAVGDFGSDGYGGPADSMVLRWNGSSWSRQTLPAFDGVLRRIKLNDVVAISSNDVWVVGVGFSWQTFQLVPYLLHWNGQSWQQSTIPNPPYGEFHGVTALSATKVYAVGWKNSQTLVARWNGSTWNQETTPSPSPANNLVDASATGTGTVWATGYRHNGGPLSTLMVRTSNG